VLCEKASSPEQCAYEAAIGSSIDITTSHVANERLINTKVSLELLVEG
jgi:hypothetical protein